jgi:hypothetical protein
LIGKLAIGNPAIPSPQELLWYIRKGYIRVMAREWWLNNEERRKKHRWRYAGWVDGFDDRILEIWMEDQHEGRTGLTARVVAVSPETARTWEREQLETDHYTRLLAQVDLSLTPAAYRQRFREARSKKEKLLSLLRDTRVHAEGFAMSGADRNFGTPVDAALLTVFIGRAATPPSYSGRSLPNLAYDLSHLIGAINGILDKIMKANVRASSQAEVFSRVKQILEDEEELRRLREWASIGDLFTARTSEEQFVEHGLRQKLITEIQLGLPQKRLLGSVLGETPMEQITNIGSLLFAGIGIWAGSSTAPISLGLYTISRGIGLLKCLGFIPESYSGPNWPFYLVESKKKVSRRRREVFIRELRK